MRLWLKTKILATHKTQADFARACGKSDDWISKIVTGRRDPTEAERSLITSQLRDDPNNPYLFRDWQ